MSTRINLERVPKSDYDRCREAMLLLNTPPSEVFDKEAFELNDKILRLHHVITSITGRFKCEQENRSASFRGGDAPLSDGDVVGGEE